MKRTFLLCLLLFVFIMTSVVNAQSLDNKRDLVPQEKLTQDVKQPEQQSRDRDEQERLLHEKQERDKQLRDNQEHDRQIRERQDRDRQIRDKQERDRQIRERQDRDRQIRDKQERDRQIRERQDRDRQIREKQERDRQIRERHDRDRQIREKQEHDRQIRENHERDRQIREREERERLERERHEQDRRHRESQHNRRLGDHWKDGHHDWSHDVYQHENWRWVERPSYRQLPFKWHDHFRDHSSRFFLEAIHDNIWVDRFPGLHPYRWHDSNGLGFWYRERYIDDAILFYNDYDELVSVGFIHDGIFIMLRDDDRVYENHDSFFFSWWDENFGIRIRL